MYNFLGAYLVLNFPWSFTCLGCNRIGKHQECPSCTPGYNTMSCCFQKRRKKTNNNTRWILVAPNNHKRTEEKKVKDRNDIKSMHYRHFSLKRRPCYGKKWSKTKMKDSRLSENKSLQLMTSKSFQWKPNICSGKKL